MSVLLVLTIQAVLAVRAQWFRQDGVFSTRLRIGQGVVIVYVIISKVYVIGQGLFLNILPLMTSRIACSHYNLLKSVMH